MNRVILVMLTLAMGMQGMILYRQHATSTTKRTLAEAPVRVPLEPTKLELKGLPTKGGPSASVAIVEFSDYECPFCERHATQVGPEIEKKIVSLGKVRMFFVNNPLPNHNNAKMLAAASICAGNQGHFWEMHAALFAKKPRNLSDVTSYAQEFGLDRNKFQGCLDDPRTTSRIGADLQIAKDLGLNSTPSFGIGRINPDGTMKVEKFIVGAQRFEVFEKELMAMIALKQ